MTVAKVPMQLSWEVKEMKRSLGWFALRVDSYGLPDGRPPTTFLCSANGVYRQRKQRFSRLLRSKGEDGLRDLPWERRKLGNQRNGHRQQREPGCCWQHQFCCLARQFALGRHRWFRRKSGFIRQEASDREAPGRQ